MVFWHVGGAVFLFRTVFKDPRVDLRFLIIGALLPDLADLMIGAVWHSDLWLTSRGLGHTLLVAAAMMLVGMVVTRRGDTGRKRAVVLAVGMMFHLLLDGMWTMPDLLLWPLPGGPLPTYPDSEWSGALSGDTIWMVQEAIGLVYLLRLSQRAGLVDPGRRAHLWRTGTIST